MRATVSLLAAALALSGAPAAAQVPAQSFGPQVVGAPALGVAADGQAVLAWAGSVSVSASVRPAGGLFGRFVRLNTGGNASRTFALAVGRGGDAVVVWQRVDRKGSATGSLLASVRRPRGVFRSPVVIPGSRGGRTPAAAVAPDGTIVVAWRTVGARGCGAFVEASAARRGASFAAARRVSSACANANRIRAAMSADGTGGIVWQAGRDGGALALDAVPVKAQRFGRVRRITTGPIVGFGADAAGADTGAVVVWRDRSVADRTGARGRVLAVRLFWHGGTAPGPVSASDRIAGVPRVAGRPDGTVFVVWEQGGLRPEVTVAEQAGRSAAYTPPAVIDRCGATDASRTYAWPALNASRSAAVVFQSGCMSRFGLGTDYGIVLARRAADTWQAPQGLSYGTYSRGATVGSADSGELVSAWLESGTGGGAARRRDRAVAGRRGSPARPGIARLRRLRP